MDISELYEVHYEPCLRFARAICRSREEAEDVCQGAFIRAMSHLPLLNVLPENKRRSWLYTVIRNMYIDALRKTRRGESIMRDYHEMADEEDYMGTEILRWDVESLVASLPQQDQDLIIKRFWLNMNSTQIGKEMNLSPAAVRHRLRATLKRLKNIYERREG
jgi:RNA polymerase sigma-70 factor (ECF subfamily)